MPAGNPRAHQGRSKSPAVSILVLVDACRKLPAALVILVIVEGFNPCSRGCLPETKITVIAAVNVAEFQSLFSWMPAGNCVEPMIVCQDPMVSILVLVDACRKHMPR